MSLKQGRRTDNKIEPNCASYQSILSISCVCVRVCVCVCVCVRARECVRECVWAYSFLNKTAAVIMTLHFKYSYSELKSYVDNRWRLF